MSCSLQHWLRWAAGQLEAVSDSARLDAEILLRQVLEATPADIITRACASLSHAQSVAYAGLVERRQQGEPIAYITGIKEFWSRDFRVKPEVLVPRPETELLVEKALTYIPADRPALAADLGTGCGNIAITLALERPDCRVLATDISSAALEVARENAVTHQVDNIEFRLGDWLSVIDAERLDLIVANPPYVAENDPHLQQAGLSFEPMVALSCGKDGLHAMRMIIQQAATCLVDGGRLLLEHGFVQSDAVAGLMAAAGFRAVESYCDLAGHPRVTGGLYTDSRESPAD